MAKYNDIDKKNWRDYADIITDSLWLIDRRDNSGAHDGNYHGNFVPQIPHQLFTRYTKRGDWILDGFMGSGTSLIEAQRMGRNSIGIELQQSVADEAPDVGSKAKALKGSARRFWSATVVRSICNRNWIDWGSTVFNL